MSLLDMTWASANTPMYFEPAKIERNYYISGDNAARSPAMFSYLHAFLANNRDIRIVSVGSTNEKANRARNYRIDKPIHQTSKERMK